jgi:hypothetical protein
VIACLSDEVLRTRQLRAKLRGGGQQGARSPASRSAPRCRGERSTRWS